MVCKILRLKELFSDWFNFQGSIFQDLQFFDSYAGTLLICVLIFLKLYYKDWYSYFLNKHVPEAVG